MKRLLSLLHCRHLHLGILAIVCLSIFTSCDDAPNNSGEGSPSEPEEQWDKWDLRLGTFSLGYDVSVFLRDFRGKYKEDPVDWDEMKYHHILSDFGSLSIQHILPGMPYGGLPNNGPVVRFGFQSTDLKIPINITYTKYDADLCVNSTVHDAPHFNGEYVCDFRAQTLTTSRTHITIKWERIFTMYGEDPLSINLYGSAVYVYPYVKSTTGDDEVAVRETGGERVVVENTVPFHLRGETVSLRLLSTRAVISDILSQPVLKGGRVTTYKWKEPKLAKIQSK